MRDSIGQAGASAQMSALKDALRAPKKFADSTVGRLPLPDRLKDLALLPYNVLDEVSRLLPTLARADETDTASLQAFGSLWDELQPRLNGEGAEAAGGTASGAAAVGGGNAEGDAPFGLPSPEFGLPSPEMPSLELPAPLANVQTNAGPLIEQLTDPDSRLRNRLPLFGTLSRRFGATLLRRVALRLEREADLPGAPSLTKEVASRAAAVDRRIAEIIEPEPAETQAAGRK